ncbi:MAG: SPOR domain-containing protein [Aeromonas sp.]
MTECHLRKCNTLSLVRQIVLGLLAGILCFLVLSYVDSSDRKDGAEVAAPAPESATLPEASQGEVSGATASLIPPTDAGFPLPESDSGAIESKADGMADKAPPMLNMPVSGALLVAPEEVVEPEPPMPLSAGPSASLAKVKPAVPSEPVPGPAPASVPKPVPAPKPHDRAPGKVSLTPVSVLQQKNIDHFSVQLMGAGSLAAIEQFVLAHRLDGEIWVYRTSRHGSPWYVVLKGDHASLSQAQAAIRQLPPALQKAQPWPKSFAQVNRELKP